MILGLEIAMIVMGLCGIFAGKFTLSGTKVVRGLPARIIGLIGLLPLPLSFMVGFLVGSHYASIGRPLDESARGMLIAIEAGITLGCFGVMMAAGFACASPKIEPPSPERKRKTPADVDDEDAQEPEAPMPDDTARPTGIKAGPAAATPRGSARQQSQSRADEDDRRVSRQKEPASLLIWILIAAGVGGMLALMCVLASAGMFLVFRADRPAPLAQRTDLPKPAVHAVEEKLVPRIPEQEFAPKTKEVPPVPEQEFAPKTKEMPPVKVIPVIELPALPEPLEIKPPDLTGGRVECRLPGSLVDCVVGGGGRFLILHLPKEKQIAVLDVNEARIVKYLPTGGDDVFVAAGMTKLLVVHAGKDRIERWDLLSHQREADAPLPAGSGQVRGVAMGSASNGPLLIGRDAGAFSKGDGPASFLDITTFKPLPGGQRGSPSVYKNWRARASADGRVFNSHMENWNVVWQIKETGLVASELRGHFRHVIVPGPDGEFFYTTMGVYARQGGRVAGKLQDCLPAVHGPLFVSLKYEDETPVGLSMHLSPDGRSIGELKNITFDYRVKRFDYGGLAADRHLHFIPKAKLLATIPDTLDRVVLQRLDPEELLEKSGQDYLVIMSTPPTTARLGQNYSYSMSVLAKQKGVKYHLEAGPPGMAVSPGGTVHWPVPPGFAERSTSVIIAVRQAGQETLQSWQINIAKE